MHSLFWECFAEIAKSENDSVTSDAKASEELTSCILLSLLSRKDNPLVWWGKRNAIIGIQQYQS